MEWPHEVKMCANKEEMNFSSLSLSLRPNPHSSIHFSYQHIFKIKKIFRNLITSPVYVFVYAYNSELCVWIFRFDCQKCFFVPSTKVSSWHTMELAYMLEPYTHIGLVIFH